MNTLEAIKAKLVSLTAANNTAFRSEVNPANLGTLLPRYNPKEHSLYVKRLLRAVCDEGCCNIALSGSYGSGKSSIVNEFANEAKARRRRIAMVSLETLELKSRSSGFEQPSEEGQGVPGPKAIPSLPSGESLTESLEREILSQLLYQGDPRKARHSSFNRPRSMGFLARFASAVVSGLALSMLVLMVLFCADNGVDKLAAWRSALESLIDGSDPQSATLLVVLFIVMSLLSFRTIGHLPRGMRVSSVGAAGASLTLAEGERSYFDKYRDELIYLFESNRFDVVVFEDIDRFDDHRIFVELRNLNFVLNHAPGITDRPFGHQVCFVYAVKDSLFGSLSGEDDPSVVDGSARAKLFDQIISVIPFMSELSAHDQAVTLFKGERDTLVDADEAKRFDDLLRLTAPQIADMRLLTSVKNDYLVMCEELGIDGSKLKPSTLGLTPTGALAMSVYKNVYPAEFEKLRLGKGSLNDLYSMFAKLKASRLASFGAVMELAREHIDNGWVASGFAEKMGELLREALKLATSDMRYVSLSNEDFYVSSSGGISSVEFWTAFFELGLDDRVVVSNSGSGSSGGRISFSKRQFIRLFAPVLEEMSYPNILELSDGALTANDFEAKVATLRGADFIDLLDIVDYENGKKPFRAIVEEVMGSGLACDLVTDGFICSDFDLYTSKYPEDARANAINFVRHNYQANLQDVDYPLDAEDCREVLRYIPASHLSRPCCFNADLLECLVDTQDAPDGVRSMVHGACTHFAEGGKALLDALFSRVESGSEQALTLVEPIADSYEGAFDYLADICTRLYSEQGSLTIAQEAIANFNDELDYTCESCRDWIQGNLDGIDFPSLAASEKRGVAVATFFARAGLTIPSLRYMGDDLAGALIDLEYFEPNRQNFVYASGGEGLSPLDTLHETCAHAFNMVVSSKRVFKAYIGFLNDGETVLTSLDPSTLQSLAAAFESWGDDDALWEATSALVVRGALESVVDVNSEVLELLEGYPSFCGAIIRALLTNALLARNLANSVTLAKASASSSFDGAKEAFASFISRGNIDIGNSDGVNGEGAKALACELLKAQGVSDQVVLELMATLEVSGLIDSPVDVSSVKDSELAVSFDSLKKLCNSDCIGPLEHVYDLLSGANWPYREAVLFKWDGGQTRPWNIHFPLLADDIPHVISSRKLKGTWLHQNVVDYWPDYLNSVNVDEKDREKLEKKIGKRIEKLQA